MKKLSGSFENQLKGVSVQNITPDVRENLNLPARVTGVVVADIDEDSPAYDLLAIGDIIMEVNRTRVSDVREYETIVAKLKSGESILLLIYRDGTNLFVTL